jgi:hypothetical protein
MGRRMVRPATSAKTIASVASAPNVRSNARFENTVTTNPHNGNIST